MDKYHVTTIRQKDNQFPFCFREMARLIQYGLQDLGHDCTRGENSLREDRVNVIFGYHEWWKPVHPLTAIRDYEVIIYQAEQLQPGGRRMPDWYYPALKQCKQVWDYSTDNISICELNDIKSCHVPPSWSERYIPIELQDDKESDVLFMGAINARRQFMLKLLGSLCDVAGVNGVWGTERDEFMASTKLLVNIHYYHSQTLELLRLTHCLNSGIPVVTEFSEDNPYGDGVVMCQYPELPSVVLHYVNHPDELRDLGKRGQDVFRETSMADVIEKAMKS